MWRYAAVRTGVAFGQTALVLVAAFGMTALLPGDAAASIAGESATRGQVAALRSRLGLDQPLPQRFWEWLTRLCHGDLGDSVITGVPVGSELGDRFAGSAILAAATIAVLLPLALATGVSCGLHEHTRLDRTLNTITVGLHAVPEFVLGLLLIAVFSVAAGWLPATAAGMSGPALLGHPAVLVLPVTVLLGRQLCELARQLRVGVAANARGPVARHLRLLGVGEGTVLARHVLPAAMPPVLQQFARTVEGLLCGTVIVESLFAMHGLGTGFVEAVRNRDIPSVQGYVLVFAGTIVVLNLLGDLLAYRFSPRGERGFA